MSDISIRKCAWLSRHAPTADQAESLREYEIVQVDRQFDSAQEAWDAANEGGAPALVMAVLPLPMLAEFLRLANVPVIRAVMEWPTDEAGQRKGSVPVWTGRWERLVAVNVVTEEWRA